MDNIFTIKEFFSNILQLPIITYIVKPLLLLIFVQSLFSFLDKKTGMANNKHYTPRFAIAAFEPIIFGGIIIYGFNVSSSLGIWFSFLIYIIVAHISAIHAFNILFEEDAKEIRNVITRIMVFRKLCFSIGLHGEIPEEAISRLGKKKAKRAFYRLVPMVMVGVLEVFVLFVTFDSVKRFIING